MTEKLKTENGVARVGHVGMTRFRMEMVAAV